MPEEAGPGGLIVARRASGSRQGAVQASVFHLFFLRVGARPRQGMVWIRQEKLCFVLDINTCGSLMTLPLSESVSAVAMIGSADGSWSRWSRQEAMVCRRPRVGCQLRPDSR